MRSAAAAVEANLNARAGRSAKTLYWVSVGSEGGGPFQVGFWEGLTERGFLIDGQARTYYGAALAIVPKMVAEVGLVVRMHRAELNMLNPQVENLVRGYELEGASVEVHTAYFDEASNQLLGTVLELTGKIRLADVIEPASGGAASCEIGITSAADSLDRGVPLHQSDAALQERNPGDRFRRYNDVVDGAEVRWGELTKRQKAIEAQRRKEAEARQRAAAKAAADKASNWGP